MTLYFAAWQEKDAAPPHAPAGGSWVPMPWDKARDTLVEQLERNLDHWARTGTKTEYVQALASLRIAEERPSGLVYYLGDHTLMIKPAAVSEPSS